MEDHLLAAAEVRVIEQEPVLSLLPTARRVMKQKSLEILMALGVVSLGAL